MTHWQPQPDSEAESRVSLRAAAALRADGPIMMRTSSNGPGLEAAAVNLKELIDYL